MLNIKPLHKIKKVLVRHCAICHKNFPWFMKEHKCKGVCMIEGECYKCNPEFGRKHCPACGNLLA